MAGWRQSEVSGSEVGSLRGSGLCLINLRGRRRLGADLCAGQNSRRLSILARHSLPRLAAQKQPAHSFPDTRWTFAGRISFPLIGQRV